MALCSVVVPDPAATPLRETLRNRAAGFPDCSILRNCHLLRFAIISNWPSQHLNWFSFGSLAQKEQNPLVIPFSLRQKTWVLHPMVSQF